MTTSFQRSARLRDLLLYLTDRTLSGQLKDLTENQIGRAVFGKSADYSPAEDSSVRVHARQLRLKLHEYFNGEGRQEPIVIEIPKGAYTTVFRSVIAPPATVETISEAASTASEQVFVAASGRQNIKRFMSFLPWALVSVLACLCIYLSRSGNSLRPAESGQNLWPLSSVFDSSHRTYIVLADSNYGMFRIIGQRPGSLEDYLRPEYPKQFLPLESNGSESLLLNYVSGSTLTSYADVIAATTIMSHTHAMNSQTVVRSARDLHLRDFDQGNFVLLGSASSNPWVSLFEDKLNFHERETKLGQTAKYFENRHPLPGEQKSYVGLENTGQPGVDYASIALLPTLKGQGHVLVLQGLQQEGTEAAGEFLGNPDKVRQLREALGGANPEIQPTYFEALIRTTALAGTPNSAEIVSVRRIP